MTLGKMTPLRRLCLAHRITRAQLAEKAGISLRQLYNIEAGDNPTEATIFKIADALGVDAVYIADVLAGRVEIEREAAA